MLGGDGGLTALRKQMFPGPGCETDTCLGGSISWEGLKIITPSHTQTCGVNPSGCDPEAVRCENRVKSSCVVCVSGIIDSGESVSGCSESPNAVLFSSSTFEV